MLFERHLGQERSLSSPCSTLSSYSWPHIMHRNGSIAVVAIAYLRRYDLPTPSAGHRRRLLLLRRFPLGFRLRLEGLTRVLDLFLRDSFAQFLHLVHYLGELMPLGGADPFQLEALGPHAGLFQLVPQTLHALDRLAIRVDVMTVKRALKDIHVTNPLDVAGNGEEALEFLNDQSNEEPCIILLDLNMPRMNGIEFLEIAKRDNRLKRIPVVVLTTSKEQQDKIESFDLGVAGYIVKPVDYQRFVEAVKTLDLYWTMSELPD